LFLHNPKKQELIESEIFDDHLYEMTDFKNDIFMLNRGKIHFFNKVESFDNIDNFIQHIIHPNVFDLGPEFERTY